MTMIQPKKIKIDGENILFTEDNEYHLLVATFSLGALKEFVARVRKRAKKERQNHD
jgi:hypothetical protein